MLEFSKGGTKLGIHKDGRPREFEDISAVVGLFLLESPLSFGGKDKQEESATKPEQCF